MITQTLNKSWFSLHQPMLLAIVNTWYGRQLLAIDADWPEIILLTPNSVTCQLSVNKYLTRFYTKNRFAKIINSRLAEIADYSQFFIRMPVIAGGEVDTFKPDAPPESTSVDGHCDQDSTNATFSSLVNGGGSFAKDDGTVTQNVRINAGSTTNRYNKVRRAFYLYDTGAVLPNNAVIESARHGIYQNGVGNRDLNDGNHDNSRMVLVSSNPASNTALVDGDYDSVGSTLFGQGGTQNGDVSGQYNYIDLNSSGRNNIAIGSGISKFALRYKWDFANSTTGITWANGGQQSRNVNFSENEVGKEPILEVTWMSGIPASGQVKGSGSLSGSGLNVWEGVGNLLGSGQITSDPDVIGFVTASGNLVGSGAISGSPDTVVLASGSMKGNGQLSSFGELIKEASANLSGSGQIQHEDFEGPQIFLKGSV